jgi:2-polyprenyl-6-methoxyphenol hydroxylase-like FAD-dependent oxidoreductase
VTLDPQLQRHATVVGASMAGLAAARLLADRFETVVVLDRDEPLDGAHSRKGVPQSRHAHALLAAGANAISGLFPGIMDELMTGGAVPLDFNEGFWFQAGGYRARSLVERAVISASRPFIEDNVRRRVRSLPNVRIESGVAVDGLEQRDGRVCGVRVVKGSTLWTIETDLVVDCSGRSSQGTLWLEELGYPAPEVSEVRCDMRYATMTLRRTSTDLDGSFAVIIESPPHGKRAAFLVPIEGDRWIATIASGYGAAAPVDEESFRVAAACLPSPKLHEALSHAETVSPVALHRLVSSKRRHYERLKQLPAGFVALGDAVCSFNPIYAQGMTSAVLQAVALGACVDEHGNSAALPAAFFAQAAKVIATPWQIAVGSDFAYPECTGPKPRGTDVMNRYLHQVLLAAQVSPEVNTAMVMVQSLVAPPSILLRPSMVRAVRRSARVAKRRLATQAEAKAEAEAEAEAKADAEANAGPSPVALSA